MNNRNLSTLFMGMQENMLRFFELGRNAIPHPGDKGEATEEGWRNWLRTYLPHRYKVEKAQIIDCNGNMSDQIDIVIYDSQYSYLVFTHEKTKYVPAESVYAVIEIKQNLNSRNLIYAGMKAESVRCLKRTSIDIPYAAGTYPPKPLHDILGGIISLESDWKDPLGSTLTKNLEKMGKDQRLDFGCTLKHGSFWVNYEPKLSLNKSAEDEALLFFFLQLLMKLQKIGTVPAIDIKEYAKSLQSFK